MNKYTPGAKETARTSIYNVILVDVNNIVIELNEIINKVYKKKIFNYILKFIFYLLIILFICLFSRVNGDNIKMNLNINFFYFNIELIFFVQ